MNPVLVKRALVVFASVVFLGIIGTVAFAQTASAPRRVPRCHPTVRCDFVACAQQDSAGNCVPGESCKRLVICN
jgi:hypothetical protein